MRNVRMMALVHHRRVGQNSRHFLSLHLIARRRDPPGQNMTSSSLPSRILTAYENTLSILVIFRLWFAVVSNLKVMFKSFFNSEYAVIYFPGERTYSSSLQLLGTCNLHPASNTRTFCTCLAKRCGTVLQIATFFSSTPSRRRGAFSMNRAHGRSHMHRVSFSILLRSLAARSQHCAAGRTSRHMQSSMPSASCWLIASCAWHARVAKKGVQFRTQIRLAHGDGVMWKKKEYAVHV